MRQLWVTVLILIGLVLSGCQASPPPDAGEEEGACLERISPEDVSQEVYDALREEWDGWNRLSQESKMLSSRLPGHCWRYFDDWAECEEFLGLSISNPLETCSWLEQGTYAAMPLGFMDASRVQASWYGTEDGHVEWITAEAGYRDGPVRVMVRAALYGDAADTKPSDSGWSVELERQAYLEDADSAPLQITSRRTQNYFANEAWRAQGPVLYYFNIVGEPDMEAQVEETLDKVLEAFFQAPDTGIN